MAASGQIPVTASNVTGLAAGVMARARRIEVRLGYFSAGRGAGLRGRRRVLENLHQPGPFRRPRDDAKPRTGPTRSNREDQQAASGLRSRPRPGSTYSTSTPPHSAGPPTPSSSA
jgi:hypothetical protein